MPLPVPDGAEVIEPSGSTGAVRRPSIKPLSVPKGAEVIPDRGAFLGGKDTGTVIEDPNKVEKFTGIVGRDIEHGLKKVGVPDDAAETVGDMFYQAGPHRFCVATCAEVP